MLIDETIEQQFDVIVIGGGATGLGVAVEAASRGYKTILLEGHDFGKGTSSKSTKLIHGGLRYLANLDLGLVKEGLTERYYFLNNAKHIAKTQPYLVPLYSLAKQIKYFIGVKLYDFLGRKQRIAKSIYLNPKKTLNIAPHLNPEGLRGSVVYFDGQFDDTRMLITLLRTFEQLGGAAYNYHEVIKLIKNDEFAITGVKVLDKINNKQFTLYGAAIINATGTLTDTILDMDEPAAVHKNVAAAQGTHLVFAKDIFDSSHAIVIPETSDGRVLFVLPWHDKIVVGTTDIPIDKPTLEPTALSSEIDFILDTLNNYTIRKITRKDIKSIFAGQRPLVYPSNTIHNNPNKSHSKPVTGEPATGTPATGTPATAKISRKHEILLSQSGLISAVGGKWTIYRLMGEDAINFAIAHKFLPPSKSISKTLSLFGNTDEIIPYPLNVYGSDYTAVIKIQEELGDNTRLHPRLPYYIAEVIYHIRYEKARTIEDILMRRTRSILLDAKAAIEIAPNVAKILATELNYDQQWIDKQLIEFNEIAANYLVQS